MTQRRMIELEAKIPTTRNGITLTSQEIATEINNYSRQISAMRYEINVLKAELRSRSRSQAKQS